MIKVLYKKARINHKKDAIQRKDSTLDSKHPPFLKQYCHIYYCIKVRKLNYIGNMII